MKELERKVTEASELKATLTYKVNEHNIHKCRIKLNTVNGVKYLHSTSSIETQQPWAGLEPATIRLYFRDFMLSALPHYDLI